MVRLEKWYLDVTSEPGAGAIVYGTSLRYREVTVHYQSLLLRGNDGRVRQRARLRAGASLRVEGDEARASLPAWRLEGVWHRACAPVEATVIDTPEGAIHWRCEMPAARATVRVGDTVIEGHGYVERVTMTLAPWRIPWRALRWGRYVSSRRSLVWIRLDEGAAPYQGSWLDGAITEATLRDEPFAVETPAGALTAEAPSPLREGRLDETALSMVPAGLKRLFPRGAMGLEEHKWIARGAFGDDPERGVVIHERVRFP